ncbi:MAG: FtsW/RodA/SpoVE family cell cycle protein [Eubacteriales bacterium]|nr:FtsW/RodA/SpoVE family cell cycle protein [Eubacteriales bacterium]
MKKYIPYIKDFFHRADIVLLALCCICTIFGMVLISSATASYGNSARFLIVQTGAFIIGLGLFVVLTVIDIDILADKWPLLFGFAVFLLLLLVPFGEAGDTGNKGWLRFAGIGIQPSEVVKIIYIVLMARHVSYLREFRNLQSPFSVVQVAVHFGFFFVLIVMISDDLGSALVFFFIAVVMLFAAGLRLLWFLIGAAGVAAVSPILWNFFLREDQKNRILAPYVESVDPSGFDVTWQARQSKLALASGQLTGTGLYQGPQSQSDAIPQKHTDFIFAVAGEELGMIACILIIVLLMLIVLRCIYIGIKCKNTTGMLVCFGVASTVLFQTFINTGMCIGITPVIGITLPYFSYGGSSLFAMFAAAGLVSGIRYRPKPERFRRY